MVQGTNLQHALMLAGRHLRRHPDAEPVVLVVTDGEPTAHLQPRRVRRLRLAAGARRRSTLTMAEVVRLTRRGATINVFMLDDEPRLVALRRPDGQAQRRPRLRPDADRLGDYVVSDYLRARRGRRRSA